METPLLLNVTSNRTGEVQVHKSEWLTRLAGGLVKTQLLVFTTLFTTLFCFLLRYLLRYGRRQRMTFMFFGTVQNASTVGLFYCLNLKPNLHPKSRLYTRSLL